jgi:hypothetical protein
MTAHLWQPEDPAGHLPFCAHPAHPLAEYCRADPDDPPSMAGEPSRAWLADHGHTPCTGCGTLTDPLAVFPGGVCLGCWAQSPEGCRMPAADEVVSLWGGPVNRRRAY